ncbi:hypothetical protein J8N05_03925 [Streptomyces sp. BH-SS-21]|uniref:NACHT domain-containing protein n=1 Tax=Streptomyces liliiviolaceus TaxID=2823109 RepID=A0A940XQ17_9ACTN|nr:WD40 repeat domain-containing protein [Streptomyces liliiviolaceus]MBQ0847373.1 hypothetical protein [Streptomyces liliiviolaceus]
MTQLSTRRNRHRIIRDAVLAVIGTACIGFAVWFMTTDFGGKDADDPVAVLGLIAGIASLLVALADLVLQQPAPPSPAACADDLADSLRAQWREESQARGLHNPQVLPLAWAATRRPVADSPGGRTVRLRLDGRLQGVFSAVTAQLATAYQGLPQRRLVTIGEPGAGKTVLALLLTLGLLDARQPGDPVPVMLSASSWDPVRERLDDWIARSLAASHYDGRLEIPRILLSHGLLLPILDGLDEIPESARRSAVRGLNHAIGDDRPVVVTCRATEYEDLIRGGAPTLRRAPVIEVSPVLPEDAIGYLEAVPWPNATDWTPVFDRLRTDPGGHLATALSTPLMVTSVRLVYQHSAGDPAELLDPARFDCQFAVEDHVIHQLVDAAYSPAPGPPGGGGPRRRWTAEQARGWLTFLACYLHDHRERDLAWWRMSDHLLSRWMGPAVGIGLGVVLALFSFVWNTALSIEDVDSQAATLAMALIIGGGFALLSYIVWYAASVRPPGRLTVSAQGALGRLRRGFGNGAALSAVSVAPLMLAGSGFVVLSTLGGPGSLEAAEFCAEMLMVCLSLTCVLGMSLAAHSWLSAPPSRASRVSPRSLLRQDRVSSLTGALTSGLVVAATGLAGWYAGVLLGDVVFRVLTYGAGWPGQGAMDELAEVRWRTLRDWFSTGGPISLLGLAVLLPGTAFALLVLLPRAWPRFVLTRSYLAARGKLPWRLMTFLADARQRELLRQSAGVYQFRHIRLQEALAGQPTYAPDRSAPPADQRKKITRRVVLAVGAGSALTLAAGGLIGRHDRSRGVFHSPEMMRMTGVAFRPGNPQELAVVAADGTLWLWNGDSSYEPSPLHEGGGDDGYASSDVAFHRHGRYLAAAMPGAMQLRDMENDGKVSDQFSWDEGDVEATVAAMQNGDHIAGTADDKGYLWRVTEAGRLTKPSAFNAGENGSHVAEFLPDDSLLTTTDELDMAVFRTPALTPLHKWPTSDILATAASRSGTIEFGHEKIITCPRNHRLVLIDFLGGYLVSYGSGGVERLDHEFGPTTAAAFSPSGRLLAVAEPHGDVRLFAVGSGIVAPTRLATLYGHTASVSSIDFSHDERLMATAGEDGTVRVWKLADFGVSP